MSYYGFIWKGNLRCFKSWETFSSESSKEKKPCVRKKLPVTKLYIVKTSRMSFQCYENRFEHTKNERSFVWKSAPNQAFCKGFLGKRHIWHIWRDFDVKFKFGKIFSHLAFVLHTNLLKTFYCLNKSKKLSIMKTELNISTTTPKSVKTM